MESLLKNPKFWVAVVAVIAMIVASSVPQFNIDGEQVAATIVILVAYLYGVIRDPGGTEWRSMLKSRKFWTALVGLVALWLTAFQIELPFGLTYDMVIELIMTVASALILAFANIQNGPVVNVTNTTPVVEVETKKIAGA